MVDSIRVRGPLDLGSLRRAFTTLLRRHEILRTAFVEVDGELWQTVSSQVPDALQIVDLSGYDDPLPAVHGFALDHASTIHDLHRTPLVRAAVLRLDAADHVLLFNMHHIISDGWSLDVLIREFMTLYGAAVSGNPDPLPPLEIQYRDYVSWQHERWLANAETARDYWVERLRDVPAALELPTDYPRPPIKTYAGGRCHVPLPKASGQQLRRLARQQDVTLSMLLTALVKVLLYRYSGQSEISVGCPVAGRTHPDLEHQIGLYVNTLVLRDQLAGAQPFAEFLRQVRETVMGALAHQEYPFDRVVHDVGPPRDPSRNPLFDVMVALQNTANVSLRLPDLEISSLGLDYGVTQFDLLWNFIDAPEGLYLELQYNSDLFRRETIEAMIHHWQTLAASVVVDPTMPIGRLPLLEPAERSALIEVPASRPQAPAYRSLVEWLEAQVARAPTAIAVTDGERHLTYAELNARANQAARGIRGRLSGIGVVGEPLVGICMHRSVEQVIGVLGILKAGAAYVPLDPDAPVARLRYILQDAGVSLLVTDGRTADLHAAHEYELTADEEVTAGDSQNLDVAVDPSAAAYVIYTSGSTGASKGAVITHGNVLRLFASTAHWFRFSSEDVWTLFHSYAFDFSVWEIWGALLYGGRLVIVPYTVSRDPDQFYQLLSREGATVLNQTPSAFRQLIQAEAARQEPLPLSLRYIIFGGEALQPSQLQPWFDRHGDRRPQLVNMYGITETTVHVTYRPVRASDARQTASLIGVPIPDLYLYVLDEYCEPVPMGVPGELYVGGAGLARGYLFRDQLTAERFVRDPFRPGERLYRTGDRVRRRRDGELEYLGRLDSQIKIRGHRIEAGEITAVLSLHRAVREAVVSVRRHQDDTYLLAYYVPSDGAVSEAELRRHLQEHLPAYMVPQAFTPLPRLPLTVNGKLDERALPDPQHTSMSATNGHSRAPRDGLEREVLELWRRLLGHERLGPDDNVFEHGAHSVLAVQARNHLQSLLGRELPVVLLFQYPTPAALAMQLERGNPPEDDTMTARQRASQRRAASQQARQRRESREITR
jgi:amino acid adenylation domain-containing protein